MPDKPAARPAHAFAAAFRAGNGPRARSIGYEPEMCPTLTAGASGTTLAPTLVYVDGVDDAELAKLMVDRGDDDAGSPDIPAMTAEEYDAYQAACRAALRACAAVCRPDDPQGDPERVAPILAALPPAIRWSVEEWARRKAAARQAG